MPVLKSIKISGFRSIKEMSLELRPLNILIGANGAGKSNLIAFFKFVNELMGGRLQQHIGATGRATGNLHFGPNITPQLEAKMVFEVDNGTDTYYMRLFHAAGDSLIFAEETLAFHEIGYPRPRAVSLGSWSSRKRGLLMTRQKKANRAARYTQTFAAEPLPRLSLPRYIADFKSPAVLLCQRQSLAHARCSESGGDIVCAQVQQGKGISPDCGDNSASGTIF